MRRTVPALVFFCLLTLGFAAAQDESLGDAARQARMRKTSPAATEKVYTNDNLPTSGGIGIAALTPNPLNSASSSTASTQAATDTSANAADKKLKATSPEDSPEARQKVYDDWKSKIDDQKKEISQLERELNVMQREAQIRAAVFYADAGTQLRDSKKYADESRQAQQDLDGKQKALADAKQELSDLQDQARQAGVPSSYYQ